MTRSTPEGVAPAEDGRRRIASRPAVGAPEAADPSRPDHVLLLAVRAIALIGLAAAGYLVYVKFAKIEPLCATGGCEVVLTSRWSELLGVPVPVVGATTYVLFLGSTLVAGEWGRLAGVGLATVGAAFSLFLQYQAIVVLEHFCPWCFTSACCMALLFGLTTWRFLRSAPEVQAAEPA